ncbi:Inner membrane (modular protein) [Cupriavidus taiwanensis]|uniref:Inner membrane (Modular protein) n=1 Tax=Cupriavidus taiwanensis TaxID=164546 RepID=A0A375IDI6_9BURK|nr:DUF927 domain-containing protein [Cupriavidus taiwanensis]SPK72657.1 Inner membrane (modular protein) [Cupriavidus taiwanensis]
MNAPMMLQVDLYTALAQACADVGIAYQDVSADGQWHRTDVLDDRRGKGDAAIKLFADGAGGIVCNWKGETRVFFADAGRALSDDEKARRKQLAAQAKADAEVEREARARRAAQLAAAILQAASETTAANPYLVNKGIAPTGLLYELPIKRLVKLAGYHPHSNDVPLRGQVLLAPVSGNGDLATLEMIDENGRKSALRDGTKSGGYWPTCSVAEMGNSATLLICEGVATAISAHAATGYPALAALCAGNLQQVARAMRTAYSAAAIVICADIGNGQAHAEAAARAVRGRVALPVFAHGAAINGKPAKDFNDLHQLAGLQAVRARIDGAEQIATFPSPEPNDLQAQSHGGGRFEVSARGVFFVGYDNDGNEKQPMFLCSRLRVIAKTRDIKSHAWGRLLEWHDDDAVLHRWAMPLELLQGDSADVRRELSARGLTIAPGKAARDMLAAYIQVWKIDDRARCVQRLGWHGPVYVTADEPIGEQHERVVFQNAHAVEPAQSQAGSVDDWRQSVATLAAGNSRLVFALSVAFAGALAEVVHEDSGGFHLRGGSSSGKSTALEAATSVWGPPARYVRMWRATANGLEGLAALHNDGVLILDELAQIDPREAGDAAYLLANGQGKVRATRTGTARQAAHWRLLFLSAGEVSLSTLMSRVGQKTNAGQEIRLADFKADAGAGMGAFETIHGHATSGQLSVAIKAAAARYHGTVGIAWLRRIVQDRGGRLDDFLGHGMAQFVAAVLPAGAGGQVQRVARRFALVAVAGELATRYGLTGWQQGDAVQAAKTCFAAWLESFGGAGNREERAMLEQVRAFFEAHGASRFEDIPATTDRRIVDRAGFVRIKPDGTKEYLVLPEAFRREVCQGFDPKAVAAVLISVGWLKPGGDGKTTQKPRLTGMGGPTRCYVVTPLMWEGDA